jgi:hypothetical protein
VELELRHLLDLGHLLSPQGLKLLLLLLVLLLLKHLERNLVLV